MIQLEDEIEEFWIIDLNGILDIFFDSRDGFISIDLFSDSNITESV